MVRNNPLIKDTDLMSKIQTWTVGLWKCALFGRNLSTIGVGH